jgi:hypothetical protein
MLGEVMLRTKEAEQCVDGVCRTGQYSFQVSELT